MTMGYNLKKKSWVIQVDIVFICENKYVTIAKTFFENEELVQYDMAVYILIKLKQLKHFGTDWGKDRSVEQNRV